MNLNKIVNDNGLYLYQTDRFPVINLKLYFEIPNTEKDKMLSKVLARLLIRTNKYNKNYKLIKDKAKSFYDMRINFSKCWIGNHIFDGVNFRFLDPKFIGDNYLEEAIYFASSILLTPNFHDENLLKKIKADIINEKMDESRNVENLFLNKVLPPKYLGENRILEKSELEKIINSITEKDLMNRHQNMLEKCFYKGYLYGNFTENDYKLIKDLFPFENKNKKINGSYDVKVAEGEYEITNS